jgi:hypothetical protein
MGKWEYFKNSHKREVIIGKTTRYRIEKTTRYRIGKTTRYKLRKIDRCQMITDIRKITQHTVENKIHSCLPYSKNENRGARTDHV